MIQFKTYAETLRKQTTSSFRFPTAEEVQLLASEERDKLYMSIAVMLAKNCTSYANRNLTTEAYPCVGALLVNNNQIVIGTYKGQKLFPFNKSTTAHAEFIAFKILARQNRIDECIDSTLYTTLEPCSYRNKINLDEGKLCCADHIIQSGVKRVVVGLIDPDPNIQGNGLRILENANIEVTVLNDFKDDLEALNAPFIFDLKKRLKDL